MFYFKLIFLYTTTHASRKTSFTMTECNLENLTSLSRSVLLSNVQQVNMVLHTQLDNQMEVKLQFCDSYYSNLVIMYEVCHFQFTLKSPIKGFHIFNKTNVRQKTGSNGTLPQICISFSENLFMGLLQCTRCGSLMPNA